MYRKRYCTTPGVGTGGHLIISKMVKFYIKVFMTVMGKPLLGELSCMRTGLVASTHDVTGK